MKCKFCPHTYAIKTSISRIKWHLSGEEGHGVAICRGVPKEVQEAAFLAANKRQKITASSVNVNDCGISTCPQEQNIEINMVGVGEQMISSHAIAGNDVVSMTGMRAQEDRVFEGALESRRRTEPVDRSLEQSNAVLGNLAGGAGRIQVGVQGVLEQGAGEERINRVRVRTEPVEEDVENSRRSVQVGAGARSSESLKYNKTRGVPLPTSSTKPVGQAFEENTKVIWSLLMDGEVSTIGIYGMGGVDLSSEDDVLLRPSKLSEELRKKQKWILILDNLWNNFELDRVGIPEKLKECKLIITTRSEMVCHQMACHRKIKVNPLSDGEAWTLFMVKLGRDIALS
ncbi:disease resistance protein [Populus alba x Populus x berolinensis]|uniref:Disease resistance protein n=1 Tax=Populus alba x Populus x berolinensis TaxID=444605 RepID=A0AAD6L8F1_9ROSI|nr:disease resistance protein [Populus alba x Populus x berolinensis]